MVRAVCCVCVGLCVLLVLVAAYVVVAVVDDGLGFVGSRF